MALDYLDLNVQTRAFMLEEIEQDIANNAIYISPRLTPKGRTDWPHLLCAAARDHDDDWLAAQLRDTGRLSDTLQRRSRNGGYSTARMPSNAPETLAEGEFNRFYARGLCRRAIAEGIAQVVVYRAKQVSQPRRDSQVKIGSEYEPAVILDDLRSAQGVEPALGIPPGPNSGLTLKLP